MDVQKLYLSKTLGVLAYKKNVMLKRDKIKTDLLVEFSPRSESGRSPGGGQGQGVAEVRGGKKAQDHTAGLLVMSNTATLTLLLHRHLARKEHDLVSSVSYSRKTG